MGKGGRGSVSLPEYRRPTADNFYSPFGNVTYGNGGFNFASNQGDQDFYNQLQATRNAILKSINSGDQATQDSLNQWQKTYFDEAQRLSQPQLEQSLFSRGLGGSNFYQGSLNDLISKNSNQAILNKYALANQADQQKLNNLGGLQSYENQLNNNAYNLLNLANNNLSNQDALATNRWQASLPYLATYNDNQGAGFGGLAGSVLGGLGGFALGGPAGALTGAQLGGGVGGGIDAGMGNYSYGSSVYNPILAGLGGLNLGSLALRGRGGVGGGAFGRAGTNYNSPGSSFLNNPGLTFRSR